MKGFFTTVERTPTLSHGTIAALMFLARPLLRLLLMFYTQDLRQAQFPQDAPEFVIPGPDPLRLLFIGDVAVAGYGVLQHRMTAVFLTARRIAEDRGRGCSWTTITAPDLTAGRVAKLPTLNAADADAVLIVLGVPDVLLATSPATWEANLNKLVERLRHHAPPHCRIVFAGIPPMGEFRPIHPISRRILKLQIHRLNRVTRHIAAQGPNITFVSFPDWRVGDMYVEETFSWKALHEMSARLLSAAALRTLNTTTKHQPISDGENPSAS